MFLQRPSIATAWNGLYITMMKPRSFLYILIVLFATIGACTREPGLSSKPVVKVGERQLSAKAFAEILSRKLKGLDALSAKDPANLQQAKEAILQNFIVDSITADFAKSLGITVTDEELDAEVNSVRSGYPDDLSFRNELAKESISLSAWRESLQAFLLAKKVFKKIGENLPKSTESEIRAHYEKNKESYRRKERIFLRQIVMDDLTKANFIHEELTKTKKSDFVALAKKYSVSPEGKDGGAVGWVERGSVDIFDKAFQLTLGRPSAVLESAYGFHIFKVERRAPPGVASLDEVRAQIVQLLQAKKEQTEFKNWLDKQLHSVKVSRDRELISSISVETKGKK